MSEETNLNQEKERHSHLNEPLTERELFLEEIDELLLKKEKTFELNKLKQAIAAGEKEEAKILYKYSEHISEKEFNSLISETKE